MAFLRVNRLERVVVRAAMWADDGARLVRGQIADDAVRLATNTAFEQRRGTRWPGWSHSTGSVRRRQARAFDVGQRPPRLGQPARHHLS
jgi:hypothetical protein